jgi:hypothetical protein
MRNQKGFASVTLLILTPLIVAAVAVLASGYLILKADGQTRHLCRVRLLDAQAKVSADLHDLMALNNLAATLRAERKIAEAEVSAAAAFPPVLLPPAQAHQTSVIARQLALAANQKRLILHATMQSKMAPVQTSHEVQSTLSSLNFTHSDDHLSLEFSGRTQTASFDVVASPKSALTPDYMPSRDFERKQVMKISWSFRVSALLPSWIRPLAMSAGIRAHAECSAGLKKGDQQWQPSLNADKS